jgi:hypothetical protein
MTRVVVKQSVDMRLLTMQGHKLQAISKAIRDDDKANERPQLNLKQLANLFGFLRTDEDDNIISVEPDMMIWRRGMLVEREELMELLIGRMSLFPLRMGFDGSRVWVRNSGY